MLSNENNIMPVTKHHFGIDRRSRKTASNATTPPIEAAAKASISACFIGYEPQHKDGVLEISNHPNSSLRLLQSKSVGFSTLPIKSRFHDLR